MGGTPARRDHDQLSLASQRACSWTKSDRRRKMVFQDVVLVDGRTHAGAPRVRYGQGALVWVLSSAANRLLSQALWSVTGKIYAVPQNGLIRIPKGSIHYALLRAWSGGRGMLRTKVRGQAARASSALRAYHRPTTQ